MGEQFTLHGTATDPQDGPLPDSALSWQVDRHHDTHTHPFLPPTPGNDVQITGPGPEDLSAAGNSHLQIELTATDSGGLSTTVTETLDPELVDLTFDTTPAGLGLTVAGVSITGPTTVTSWDNWSFPVNAPSQNDPTGERWEARLLVGRGCGGTYDLDPPRSRDVHRRLPPRRRICASQGCDPAARVAGAGLHGVRGPEPGTRPPARVWLMCSARADFRQADGRDTGCERRGRPIGRVGQVRSRGGRSVDRAE